MAQSLNIALSTYTDKEAGRRIFKPHEIVFICKMFGVRAEEVADFHRQKSRSAELQEGDALNAQE